MWVYSKRDGKKIRKQFPTRAAAKSWREDAQPRVRQNVMRAPTPITVGEAGNAWLDGARAGVIRTSSRRPYKPGSIRAHETAMRLRVFPEFGSRRLVDIERAEAPENPL